MEGLRMVDKMNDQPIVKRDNINAQFHLYFLLNIPLRFLLFTLTLKICIILLPAFFKVQSVSNKND